MTLEDHVADYRAEENAKINARRRADAEASRLERMAPGYGPKPEHEEDNDDD